MLKRLAALAALALVVLLTAGRQSSPTPLQLFQAMLPVIHHPRCSNCHGGVDPRAPAHPGRSEVLTGSSCETCHTDVSHWDLPATDHFFPGKSDKQLCALFSDFAAKQGRAMFIKNHIAGDELIGAAFLGDIGGARDTLKIPAAPPPIRRPAFIKLAQDWLARGQGACEVDGTITQVETVDTTEKWTQYNVDYERKEDATRTVTISIQPDGRYRADIKVDGSSILTVIQHLSNAQGVPCTVTSVSGNRYHGATTGPATVETRDTMLFADTVAPQTDYRIDVTLPKETTVVTDTNSTADLCGMKLGTGTGGTQSFDWDPFTFTIEGHLDDPRYPHLVGACEKTIHSHDLTVNNNMSLCFRYIGVGNTEAWLMNHGASASNHDGSDVPFHVITQWNIAYRP